MLGRTPVGGAGGIHGAFALVLPRCWLAPEGAELTGSVCKKHARPGQAICGSGGGMAALGRGERMALPGHSLVRRDRRCTVLGQRVLLVHGWCPAWCGWGTVEVRGACCRRCRHNLPHQVCSDGSVFFSVPRVCVETWAKIHIEPAVMMPRHRKVA